VGIDSEVTETLLRYAWPGNIRELENLIERMMLLAKNNLITINELPSEFKAGPEDSQITQTGDEKKPFKDFMRDHVENVERQMIIKCLDESGGNITKTAKQMGLSRKGLQLKMIKYNLRRESK
jgi:two-component system, NtrC family, response regulator AtoC